MILLWNPAGGAHRARPGEDSHRMPQGAWSGRQWTLCRDRSTDVIFELGSSCQGSSGLHNRWSRTGCGVWLKSCGKRISGIARDSSFAFGAGGSGAAATLCLSLGGLPAILPTSVHVATDSSWQACILSLPCQALRARPRLRNASRATVRLNAQLACAAAHTGQHLPRMFHVARGKFAICGSVRAPADGSSRRRTWIHLST